MKKDATAVYMCGGSGYGSVGVEEERVGWGRWGGGKGRTELVEPMGWVGWEPVQ